MNYGLWNWKKKLYLLQSVSKQWKTKNIPESCLILEVQTLKIGSKEHVLLCFTGVNLLMEWSQMQYQNLFAIMYVSLSVLYSCKTCPVLYVVSQTSVVSCFSCSPSLKNYKTEKDLAMLLLSAPLAPQRGYRPWSPLLTHQDTSSGMKASCPFHHMKSKLASITIKEKGRLVQ